MPYALERVLKALTNSLSRSLVPHFALESSGRLIDIRVQGRRRHSAHIAKRDDQWDEDGDLPRIDTEFSEGQKDKTQTRRGVPEGCAARKQRE